MNTHFYWETPLTKEAQKKSAFVTAEGLYAFSSMPFGLCNAPSTFQSLMETVLDGLQFKCCVIYLDDILVFGDTLESCLANLETVFERLRKANLKLRANKCFLFSKRLLHFLDTM